MSTIEEQERAGWKTYYQAVSDGNMQVAKQVFDRTVALRDARIHRKTTQRVLAKVLP